MDMTKAVPVIYWDDVPAPYLPPPAQAEQPPTLMRRPSASEEQIQAALQRQPAAVVREVEEDAMDGQNAVAATRTRSIRVGIWNIQNFGGGISGMWNNMPEPAGYDTWLDQYPEIWDIALPEIQRAKTRQNRLLALFTEATCTDGLTEEIAKYHDLVLRAYGLADHIHSLDCDVIVMLEVMQRWSGSPPGGGHTGSAEFKAIYFLYGAWYAIQNNVVNDIDQGEYASVDERILNFLGEVMPEPDVERPLLVYSEEEYGPRVTAFRQGFGIFCRIHSGTAVVGKNKKATRVDLMARTKYERYQCKFQTERSGLATGQELGNNDTGLAEYVFTNDDAAFFGAMLAHHDLLLGGHSHETDGRYLAHPPRSAFSGFSGRQDEWENPILAKAGPGKNLYEAFGTVKRLWRMMVERRGWAHSIEHMIAPMEEEPEEDEAPAFQSILAMLNARLEFNGHAQFKALKKPASLKSAETVAIATRLDGTFTISETQIWRRDGGMTFERPVHVFKINATQPDGLPCTLLAGHAPSPVHWEKHNTETKKWFSDMNDIATALQGEDTDVPVVLAGDFNISGDNDAGPACYANWTPAWDWHKDIQTSYKLRGGEDDPKWSEAFDKILIHKDTTQVVNYYAYRDARWDGASKARKYSDHSFVVADLSVTEAVEQPEPIFDAMDLEVRVDDSQAKPGPAKKAKPEGGSGSGSVEPMVSAFGAQGTSFSGSSYSLGTEENPEKKPKKKKKKKRTADKRKPAEKRSRATSKKKKQKSRKKAKTKDTRKDSDKT